MPCRNVKAIGKGNFSCRRHDGDTSLIRTVHGNKWGKKVVYNVDKAYRIRENLYGCWRVLLLTASV